MGKLKKRRFKRSQSQSQSQRWSNSLSLSMSSWPIRPDSVKKRLEPLMPLRELRFKLVRRRKSNLLFCKTNMLKIPLPKPQMPTTSILDLDLLQMTMMSHLEEEEEEVEEAAEAAEVMRCRKRRS